MIFINLKVFMTVFGLTDFSRNPDVEPYSYAPKQKDIHPCEGKSVLFVLFGNELWDPVSLCDILEKNT
jgi:hypothetical protein